MCHLHPKDAKISPHKHGAYAAYMLKPQAIALKFDDGDLYNNEPTTKRLLFDHRIVASAQSATLVPHSRG